MSDDIVTRLRKELPCWCDAKPTRVEIRDMCWEASAEIERLSRALDLAVGELSTTDQYRLWHPEQLRQQFLDEEVRGE